MLMNEGNIQFHWPQSVISLVKVCIEKVYDYVVSLYESDAKLTYLQKIALSITFCLKTQTFLSLEARNLQRRF